MYGIALYTDCAYIPIVSLEQNSKKYYWKLLVQNCDKVYSLTDRFQFRLLTFSYIITEKKKMTLNCHFKSDFKLKKYLSQNFFIDSYLFLSFSLFSSPFLLFLRSLNSQ